MRAIRVFVAALLAAGMVTVLSAQPGRQPGGFGGFNQDTVLMVLTNEDLQKEVKVTDAQKEKFNEIAEKQQETQKKASEGMREKFADAKGDQDKMRELFTEMQKEMSKVTAEARKALDTELTADQKKRLKQIEIQRMGFNVFNDPDAKVEQPKGKGKGGLGGGFGQFRPTDEQKALMKEVQKSLSLNDSQKSSIKGISADFTKESGEIRREAFSGGFDQEKMAEANKKVEKLRTEYWTKVTDVFDEGQKKAWKEAAGEPFDTSKLNQFRQPPRKD